MSTSNLKFHYLDLIEMPFYQRLLIKIFLKFITFAGSSFWVELLTAILTNNLNILSITGNVTTSNSVTQRAMFGDTIGL